MTRYLGIDYGLKRVGLATAEAGERARPWRTVAPDELARVLAGETFAAVVVGLPRGLDGQETGQTALVRRFVTEQLSPRLATEPVLQDEAGTSSVAEDGLKQAGRPYTKGDIDAAAAALILQDYLDSL